MISWKIHVLFSTWCYGDYGACYILYPYVYTYYRDENSISFERLNMIFVWSWNVFQILKVNNAAAILVVCVFTRFPTKYFNCFVVSRKKVFEALCFIRWSNCIFVEVLFFENVSMMLIGSLAKDYCFIY